MKWYAAVAATLSILLLAGIAAAAGTFSYDPPPEATTVDLPARDITVPVCIGSECHDFTRSYDPPPESVQVDLPPRPVTCPDSVCPPPAPPPGPVSCGGVFAPSGTPSCADPNRVVARTFEAPETLRGAGCCGPWWSWVGFDPSTSGGTIVADPSNSSNHVAKFTVQPQPNPYPTSPYNSQVMYTMDSRDSLGRQGNDMWYAWKLRLDPSWQGAPNTTFNWLHEFLDEPSSPGKCAGQLNYNDALGIDTTVSPARWIYQVGYAGPQTTADCSGTRDPTIFNGPNIVKGQWQTFVEHIHWSADGDGLNELWIDGQQAFHITGPNIYRHPDGSTGNETVYICDYRSNYSGTRPTWVDVTFWDNFLIGHTQSSVSG